MNIFANKYSWLALAGAAGSTAVGLSFVGSGESKGKVGENEYALNAETSTSYTCFRKLFNGTKKPDPAESSAGYIAKDDGPSWEAKSSVDKTPNPEKTIGCTWMGLKGVSPNTSYGEDSGAYYSFYFDAEIAIRGENIGWSLSVDSYGHNYPDYDNPPTLNYTQRTSYTLYLLEKVNSSWEVRRGYFWEDGNSSLRGESSIYIDSPWGELLNNDQAERARKNKDDKAISSRKNLGIWTPSGSGSGEIFQEIKLGNKTRSGFQVLGRTDDFSPPEDNDGHKYVNMVLKDGKWHYVGSQDKVDYVDISGVLHEWYTPFRDVNGSWKKLSDYCSSSGNQSPEFCEIKK